MRPRISESDRRRWYIMAAMLAVYAHPLAGQSSDRAPADWVEDVTIGMANAFVGAATAAVTAWLRGDDVGDALVGGIVGGGIVFAGKRLAVEDFDGAGLLGREVGAVGSSVVRNAAEGRPWLGEVWLPLGPIWLQANPASSDRVRVNMWSVARLGWAATRSELEVDWSASLSSGAFVFNAPAHELRNDGETVLGFASGGLIVLGPEGAAETRAHERVHVIQQDFVHQTWSRPVERRGWQRLFGRDVPVDFGLIPLLLFPPLVEDLHEAESGALGGR